MFLDKICIAQLLALYPIDRVSAKIILKRLGQRLNECKWLYNLYFLLKYPKLIFGVLPTVLCMMPVD